MGKSSGISPPPKTPTDSPSSSVIAKESSSPDTEIVFPSSSVTVNDRLSPSRSTLSTPSCVSNNCSAGLPPPHAVTTSIKPTKPCGLATLHHAGLHISVPRNAKREITTGQHCIGRYIRAGTRAIRYSYAVPRQNRKRMPRTRQGRRYGLPGHSVHASQRHPMQWCRREDSNLHTLLGH